MATTTLDDALSSIFSDFNEATPGCSVGVIRSGKVLATRGFGMATLEYDVSVSADNTIFRALPLTPVLAAACVRECGGGG